MMLNSASIDLDRGEFLVPRTFGQIKVDQLAKGQRISLVLPRARGITARGNLGEQPLRFDPRHLRGPGRAMLAYRQLAQGGATAGANAVMQDVAPPAGRPGTDPEAFHPSVPQHRFDAASGGQRVNRALRDLASHGVLLPTWLDLWVSPGYHRRS